MNKNFFDYYIPFWQVNDRDPISITEVALFHYLLNEANRNHWVMPFRCNTSMISYRLSTSRQNILKARKALKERGFINYADGVSKASLADYTLLLVSDSLSVPLSVSVSEQLAHNKIINKEETVNISSTSSEEPEFLPLSTLKDILQSDKEWQERVISLIEGHGKTIGTEDLTRYVDLFFQTLLVKGVTSKTDPDCRTHFYNWLCKQIENKKNISHGKNFNPRRGVDVPAPSEQNYEGSF